MGNRGGVEKRGDSIVCPNCCLVVEAEVFDDEYEFGVSCDDCGTKLHVKVEWYPYFITNLVKEKE